MVNSRTEKSLKNAQYSLCYYFLQLILSFFSRKVFFDYLGTEILGLNTTAANLLGFLNLAELGVGVSISFFLYQPLFCEENEKIDKIISLQGWIYRRIAYVILFLALVLMLFFPILFSKSSLPLYYAYATFGVFLFSSLLGYFVNYRQILLVADQKNYKVQKATQGIQIIKVIFQIFAIKFFSFPFVSWVILEFFFSILSAVYLNIIITKEYPWLKTSISKGKIYLKEFPDVLTKTKQVFYHRISGTILQQSSPLIIYGFTSLTTVALYGNYILIVSKLSFLMGTVFNSTGAAVGNLVASRDNKRILCVFWELFDSRLCMSIIIIVSTYYIINPFITIWLGDGYLLSKRFLVIFLVLNSIGLIRTTVDSYINAYGLYKDIWAPVVEATLNIVLSISLGYCYGLEGVILGPLISQLIVVCCWKPYFLFNEGMRISSIIYFVRIFYRIIAVFLITIVTYFMFSVLSLPDVDGYFSLFCFAAIVCVSVTIMSILIFILFFDGMRDFLRRIKCLLFNSKTF